MPLISYLCSCSKSVTKFYRMVRDVPSGFTCLCGLEMKRQLSTPSNASKIIVDNGIQAKAVEVDLQVIESNLINSTKDFTEKP